MEVIAPTTTTAPAGDNQAPTALAGMETQDFIKLLVTQLTHQDPLEPTSNEELLRQISSIREIELSTTLTDSLRSLTGQQHFAGASSLIGQYVTGLPDSDGLMRAGLVVGVRFDSSGGAVLLFSNGIELPMAQVSSIQQPLRAAESLRGVHVVGMDRRTGAEGEVVEGIVTSARVDDAGEVVLELDSGSDLRLADVVRAGDTSE